MNRPNSVTIFEPDKLIRSSSPLRIPQNHVTTPPVVQTTGASSPLLAALGAYSNTNATRSPLYPATEWANGVQFGQSPPDTYSNTNSLGNSPPDHTRPNEELRGGFSHASPPASPPANYRRPVRPNSGYQSFNDYLSSSPHRARPVSLQSQKSMYPPPPHQPQAHFYGAPEIDFGEARNRSGSRQPTREFCCVFDTLAFAGDDGSRATEDVLLIGIENGLNIYSVGKTAPNCIGRLEGLRGNVLAAKILPCNSRIKDPRPYRPLIAVIVHGLCQPSGIGNNVGNNSRPGTSHSSRSSFSASGSTLQAMQAAGFDEPDPETLFQTTVEIYSLNERKHIATLLKAPKTKPETSPLYPHVSAAPPPSCLQIQVSERFIVVAGGTSGEVFVFSNGPRKAEDTHSPFKCIGKFWTRVSQKRPRSLSISSETSEVSNPYEKTIPKPTRADVAMFSLSQRWLAVVPPLSNTQSTLHMTVEKNRPAQKIPGLPSHTAPTEPSVNCETDVPETEGLLNKVARDVTQEIIKGARWVGGQGMQAWSNYWSKPSSQNPVIPPTNFTQQTQPAFPPTHANNDLPAAKNSQPTTVSVIDLERLYDGQNFRADRSLQPIATFSLPNGCSWVSFAPSGLNLLTVSLKGDVQQIWSLMRMEYGEAGRGTANGRAPFVREIKRFTRLTVANIIDVVWTEPTGDRLAILTERGTVHINDIPAAALQWPPPRRILRSVTAPSQSQQEEHDKDLAVPAVTTSNAFGAAFSLVSGTTQPLLAAVRGRPASVGSALSGLTGRGFPATASAKGGKVVAAGFNKSVGAATGTVNAIRHMGENRLSLPGSPSVVMPGCVRWLGGKNRGLIAVTGGNIIRIHSVRQSTNPKPGKRRPSVTASKPSEFALASPRNVSGGPIPEQTNNQQSPSLGGFWRSGATSHQPKRRASNIQPLSYAEIYTNAPYQPFHTDRRVGIYIYDDDMVTDTANNDPWCFGEAIPCTKISTGSTSMDEEGLEGPSSQLENLVEDQGHQLVVTTRRKPHRDTAGNEDGEIFEDDCEVIDYAEDRV